FGDAGGGEDELLAGRQVLGFVNLVFVFDAHAGDALFQFRFVDHQASQHVSIQAANGGGCDHPFRSSARAHDRVDAGPNDGGCDSSRQVTIADQPDSRSRLAYLGNQLLVPWPVEHDDDQVFHVAVHAFGNVLQVVDHGRINVHCALAGRADHDLFHVAVRRIQQSAAFRSGQHGDGAGRAGGAQVRALEGIDGDVHLGNFGAVGKFGANFFADVKHGRLIAFALANHDGAAHGN